jgi:hypothetical protein
LAWVYCRDSNRASEFRSVKLQKLAGYGSTAGFVSAGSQLVFLFLLLFGYPIINAVPALNFPVFLVWFLALWLWLAAFAVLVLDLEWLEHPATSTRWFQVAHWATLAAVFLPVLFGIAIVTNNGTLGTIVVSLLSLCVGLSLLIHNIDALRAGLVRGTLPWIGIVDGVAFLLVAIGIYAGIGILALWIGLVFYIAWAIWMGVRLRRTKAIPTAGLAPS